ncbi:MAG: glycosyltransferase family 2 protein [Elusimicrobia bacterium]|nr:glycosyltransferase family 2 protein [Elusimicrobiota bacterium]
MELSVVVPVYNEKENLKILHTELSETLNSLQAEYEILFIDDGSTDGSELELKEIVKKDKRARLIRFTRNFGQTSAISAGIDHSSGTYLVTIDADLQNDPGDIPVLLQKAREGFDVVSGWRKRRKDAYFAKTLPSVIANFIISGITGINLHDYGCTLKIYESKLIKSLRLFGEMHRFLPALLGYSGARIAEIEVNHRPRIAGKSKYGISRTFKVILDLFTVKFMGHYLGKPIYLFGGWGIFLIFISGLLAMATLYNKFYHGIFVKDQPLFLVAILLSIIGFQMLLLGLLAEIMVRIYYETGRKPSYFIKEKIL